MRSVVLIAFLCMVFCGGGCKTSRVIEDSRSRSSDSLPLVQNMSPPDIIIDRFGDITVQGKRVALEKIVSAVKSAGISKQQKVRIFVQEPPDYDVMGKVAGALHLAGYSTLFVTKKIATSGLKLPSQ
ncbi:MAG: hypothetical protein FWH21_07850 [Kiritimatiellaeota bacterium]|nr:hypothetical protein [Kiritimatiellota bacterium]